MKAHGSSSLLTMSYYYRVSTDMFETAIGYIIVSLVIALAKSQGVL